MSSIYTPDDLTKTDMNLLADHFEEYLNLLKEVMIIPDGLKKHEGDVNQAIKVVEKLIRKLRKGDRDVFKDREDWNMIS